MIRAVASLSVALALVLLVGTVACQFSKLQQPRQLAHGGNR